MHSLVLGLLSLFLVLGRLPAVSGDCFDEPPNNSSYVNCATCYQTFANALINTADNKYRLSRAFFPISAASPVQVDVSYLRKSDEAEVEKFFWLMGGFYVFQPLDVFIYRSLLFSPPNFRKDYVSVVLPDECFGNDANFSSATELYGFFEYATQRLKGYAQSQRESPDIDSSYVGLAVGKNVDGSSFYVTNSDDIIAAAYGLPFFIIGVLVVVLFVGVFFMSLDDAVSSIADSTAYQANVLSVLLLCVILTIFTAVLDIQSCITDITHEDLPGYYTHSQKFFGVTITGLIIYLFFFTVGLYWFILEILILLFCIKEDSGIDQGEDSGNVRSRGKSFAVEVRSQFVPKNRARSKRLALICVLIIGGALLSVTAHFPSVLMAWATDSFYASRIALFYGIVIFCFFTAFRCTYVASSKAFYKSERIRNKRYYYGIVLPASLFCSFVAVSLVVVIITLYVVTVPVNNSIETASEGVTSIYNGAVVLIGGLLAYKIGWQYFGHSFSASDALKDALDGMESSPTGMNKDEWKKLTEESRLTEILKAFAESGTVGKVLRNSTTENVSRPPGPAVEGFSCENGDGPQQEHAC